MSRRRLWALVAAAVALGAVVGGPVFSMFNATTTNAGNGITAKRIFPGDRLYTAFRVTDSTGGSPADASNPLAFADGSVYTTSPTSTAFASNRYVDIDFSNPIPAGLAPQAVTFDFDFADDNSDSKTTCFYFEVRRASTNAVLGTFGSSGSPVACEPSTVPQQTSTSIVSVVTDTTTADDLRVRVYASDEGANSWLIDRATISVRAYGKTWTEYPVLGTDVLTTTPVSVPWSLALQDGIGGSPGQNWPTSFSSTSYVDFTFPANTPGAATIGSVSFENSYRSSAAGINGCYYIEVYAGGSLIGTHGSPSSPVSCNSTTTYSTDTIPLPEVDTAAKLNGLTVRLYGKSAGAKTEHDFVRLRVNYSLADTGCTDPGTSTISATKDSWADQGAPTSTTGGTDAIIRVKTQSAKNRRAWVYFPLPSLGDGCSLQSATLRLYQTAAQSTRTVNVSRATGPWSEGALNWNTQPGGAGTPVGAPAQTANAWVTWNVGTLVAEQMSSGNYGFVLKDSAEDAATAAEQQFSSREGANPPQLLLTIG